MQVSSAFLFSAFAAAVAAQYTVDPPTEAPSDTITDCTLWVVADGTETCEALASDNFLTLNQLYVYVSGNVATSPFHCSKSADKAA